jgi:hypothetical protein
MAKLTLTDLSGGYLAPSVINTNNDLIEAAFENTLSRSGTSPNAMQANIDMDSNHILNLPAPATSAEPVRLLDVQNGTFVSSILIPAQTGNANKVLSTDGSAAAWNTIQSVLGTSLSAAANKLPYFSSGTVMALADLSAAGRALIDDASAAAQATTLGLGTGDSPTFTGITATGTITATGGKIAFPAVQVASSNVNTLDDYEEGTFVPIVFFDGGSTGISYSRHYGGYTKIGDLVTISVYILLNSKGSSTGNLNIGIFPFAAKDYTAASLSQYPCVVYTDAMTSLSGSTIGILVDGGQSIVLYKTGTGTSAALTDTNVTNTSTFSFTISYKAV